MTIGIADLRATVFGGLALFWFGWTAQADDADSSDFHERTIHGWVEDLSSDSYLRRKRATRELIKAGSKAVAPVVDSLQSGELETTQGAMTILQEIAVSESAFMPPPSVDGGKVIVSGAELAWQELNRLARTGGSRAAQAIQAIQDVRDVRRTEAVARLTGAGVFIGMREFVLHALTDDRQLLQIDDGYRGSDELLSLLRWIDQVSYARLRGKAIRKPVLDRVVTMPELKTLALIEGDVDMASLRALGELPRIQNLEFRYVALDGEMVDYLAKLPITISLTLNGTGAPVERVEALQKALPGLQLDFKQGGFLGVKCNDLPRECIINQVVPGSGAEAAGLRSEDVILKVDDKDISRFSDLQAAINAHVPGDQLRIEFRRGTEIRKTSAKLGKQSIP
ncbi:MAG: PDZ domain-containing protein [Planctomycetota bacterium]